LLYIALNYFIFVILHRLPIYSRYPVKVSWVFVPSSRDATATADLSSADYARIYLINVTNTVRGGAAECRLCPRGIRQDRLVGIVIAARFVTLVYIYLVYIYIKITATQADDVYPDVSISVCDLHQKKLVQFFFRFLPQ